MKKMKLLLVGTAALMCAFMSRAQTPLDSSFTTPGFFSTQGSSVTMAATQPDGRMIVAGDFLRYNNRSVTNLIRLLPDGRIDTTFDSTAKTNGQVYLIEVLADGKILLGGAFSTFKNNLVNRQLIRLNANGTLDNTFMAPDNIRLGFSSVDLVRAQPDGKVLVYGYAVKTGVYQNDLIRLNTDGRIDTSFHCNVQLPQGEILSSLAALPDGKIVVAGTFTSFGGQAKKYMVRLLPNGSMDAGFTAPEFLHYYTYQTPYLTALLPATNGTLLVGGSFYYCGGFPSRGIVRLKRDGSVDSSFQVTTEYLPQHIAKLDTTGGNIAAGGSFYAYGNSYMLMQFKADGSFAGRFPTVVAQNGGLNNLMTFAVLPDKSYVAGGGFMGKSNGKPFNGFAHILADGTIDPTVDASFQRIGAVYKTLVTKEGKIMVGGYFDLYGTTPVSNLVRLLPSGALDPSFQNTTGPDAIVTEIAETKDSLLVIAGGFRKVGSYDANNIARLLRDGTVDTRFASGAGPNWGGITSVLPLPDGRLLVGGPFQSFSGHESRGLVRLLANGTIDYTFKTPATTPWYSIGTMALLKTNQVLVGDNSDRSTYDFTLPLVVWKVNEDGSIDSSFKTQNQGGFPIARKIDVSPAQNIYYAGDVMKPGYSPNSFTFTKMLVRLNTNGTNDSSAANFPNTFYVNDFKLLGDSAILACGRNLGWNDSANYIMRFKPDLSVDSTFNPIALFYDLKSLDCMADGRIVVAGEPVRFFNFDVEPIPNIAVLNSPSLNVVVDNSVVQNITGTAEAGTTAAGSTSTTQFKIYNTGQTTAVLGTGSAAIAYVDGPDAGSFQLSAGNTTMLRKNDSLTLTVQFQPGSQGTKTARIVIPYNNGIKQRYSFTLVAEANSVVTAIPEVAEQNGTRVYPNPSNGIFYVKSPLRQYQLYVYDALGRLVAEKKKLPADQYIPIHLEKAGKGMYWVKFVTARQTIVRPVLLQ